MGRGGVGEGEICFSPNQPNIHAPQIKGSKANATLRKYTNMITLHSAGNMGTPATMPECLTEVLFCKFGVPEMSCTQRAGVANSLQFVCET